MRKIIVNVLLLSSLHSVVFADEAETFFYEKGYDEGYKVGYEKGVKEAMLEAKKAVAKYKDTIRAYEIGKYLVRGQYLTAPQIWQSIDEFGDVKLSIKQSEIKKELNIDDIFKTFAKLPITDEIKSKKIDPISRNSVYLSNQDSLKETPSKPDKYSNIITISIEKNAKNEEILKKANLVYAVDSDRYKVMFFNKIEKDNFCKNFDICK